MPFFRLDIFFCPSFPQKERYLYTQLTFSCLSIYLHFCVCVCVCVCVRVCVLKKEEGRNGHICFPYYGYKEKKRKKETVG
jgi:hypothetical protein